MKIPILTDDANGLIQGNVIMQISKSINPTKFCHQSRSDRDDYVKILWDNIPDDRKHAFLKYTPDVIDHFNLPYDYEVTIPNTLVSMRENISTHWNFMGSSKS